MSAAGWWLAGVAGATASILARRRRDHLIAELVPTISCLTCGGVFVARDMTQARAAILYHEEFMCSGLAGVA